MQRVSAWTSPSHTETGAAAQVARAFVEAYGTFDYRDPDIQRERLLALTAGPLQETLAATSPDPAAIGQGPRRQTRVVRRRTTATSTEGVSLIVQAEVLTRRSTLAGQEATTRTTQQLRCDLVREASSQELAAEGWRVVSFRLLSEQIATSNEREVQ